MISLVGRNNPPYQYDITVVFDSSESNSITSLAAHLQYFTPITTDVQHQIDCGRSPPFYPGYISNRGESEWLWVNQDNVLTPDEKLVDVACVDLAIHLGVFLLTDLQTLGLQRDFVFVLFDFV